MIAQAGESKDRSGQAIGDPGTSNFSSGDLISRRKCHSTQGALPMPAKCIRSSTSSGGNEDTPSPRVKQISNLEDSTSSTHVLYNVSCAQTQSRGIRQKIRPHHKFPTMKRS